MTERTILHCDLNNFFASVEILKNPALRGKAIAVCGDPAKRHGIVLAKSDPAKKCGVKTGMPIWEAEKLCPGIIIVATKHADYHKYSRLVQELYYRYTDCVEAFGGDECFLDVTQSLKLLKKNGEQLADEIRDVVKNEIGLTISVGVSWNKTFAKLGSDIKKPDATTVINKENYRDVVHTLPVADMLFIGRKTARALEKMNIRTIGDLAGADSNILAGHFGINAHRMVEMARGNDTEEVKTFDHIHTVKSVGNGTTTPKDLKTLREIEQVIYILSEEVAFRMRKIHVKGYTVSLSIRNTDLSWIGAQESIREATNSVQTITKVALKIFNKLWRLPEPVMSMRVAVSNLTKDHRVQMSMLDEEHEEKNDKISATFDSIRRKYGTESIQFGTTFGSEFKLHFEVLDE